MKINKQVAFWGIALVSCLVGHVVAMETPQKTLRITVRYHQPDGITPYYFHVEPNGTVGQLQNVIKEKLCKESSEQKLIATKRFWQNGCLWEEIRLLTHDSKLSQVCVCFGMPIVDQLGKCIGYTPPILDLVCLSDFTHPTISLLLPDFKDVIEHGYVCKTITESFASLNGLPF